MGIGHFYLSHCMIPISDPLSGSPGTRYALVLPPSSRRQARLRHDYIERCRSLRSGSPGTRFTLVLPPSSRRQARLRHDYIERCGSLRSGSPGTRFTLVLPPSSRRQARLHRSLAFYGSSPWRSKKPIPKWVSAFLVARQGLEPWTHALKGRCSTN